MHGLVSLLDETHYNKVEEIWRILEEKFNLTGIKVTPFPHFSWQIAEDYDFDKLKIAMDNFSKETKSFKINTAGLGIFSGDYPVLFIPLVKTDKFLTVHKKIWDLFNDISDGISDYYHPNFWIPHISLAYTDLTKDNIGKVMEFLSFKNFNWEITIDNIAFIYEPNGTIGELKYKFKFKG